MKLITTEDKIVSLENIKTVELIAGGTGAKSNPYYYNIEIEYKDCKSAFLHFRDNEKKAKETFEKILKILSENT